jgi:hypothetical protein
MSANTPTTYSELYTDALQRVREPTTSNATAIDIMKRYLNQGLQDIHVQQNWPWAERRAILQTKASYSTGTVAISTSTRTTVTGTSTLWTTDNGYGVNNVAAGDKICFSGGTDVYTVSSTSSATSLTLAEKYVGATSLTAATYFAFRDEYALAADFWRLIDQRSFTLALPIPILSRQEYYAQIVRNNAPGQPRVSTVIDLAPSASVSPQPRVVFHPPPSLVYNLPYRYITTYLATSSAGVAASQLSADADEPIIPLRYRHMLVFYAIAEWYRDRKDDGRAASARSAFEDTLRRAANDSAPERDHPRFVVQSSPYRRGVAGYAVGGRRYSTGTAFDELRDR